MREADGPRAFRFEWEAIDARPVVVYPEPFWRDVTERLVYEDAGEANPRKPLETPFVYIVRLSEIAVEMLKATPKNAGLPRGTEVHW